MSCSTEYVVIRPGAPVPADPNCPKVQEIAAWAVAEYNKQHGACLKLVKVLKAETQVVAGINYYLDLETANGCLLNKYSAKVYDQSWSCTRELLEFKLVCQANEPIAIAN